MIKIKLIPILTRMVAKIDMKPIIDIMSDPDMVKATGDAQNDLSTAKMKLGTGLIAELLRQSDKIGEDLPEFVAIYKGVSVEEAGEMDLMEIVAEIANDEGIKRFFTGALRRKVDQKR
ncbi:MAG: hypothetical protein ACI3XR_08575 [Eubacteriales bacterium]